jgi:DNA-binding CsgD family transcriptional regulator
LARRADGEDVARLLGRYLLLEQHDFEVARSDVLEAVLHSFRLKRPADAAGLPHEDPVTPLIRRFMLDNPLGEGEEALLFRWFVDAHDYQTPTARVFQLTGRQTQLILASSNLAYHFVVLRDLAPWTPLWKDLALPWRALDSFDIGGQSFTLVVFVWRERALRDILLEQGRQPKSSRPPATAPVDGLRVKVQDGVARLAQKVNLTRREAEILEELCLGSSNESIAQKLSIRPRTVKFHQENLLRKTGASSRIQLFQKIL